MVHPSSLLLPPPPPPRRRHQHLYQFMVVALDRQGDVGLLPLCRSPAMNHSSLIIFSCGNVTKFNGETPQGSRIVTGLIENSSESEGDDMFSEEEDRLEDSLRENAEIRANGILGRK